MRASSHASSSTKPIVFRRWDTTTVRRSSLFSASKSSFRTRPSSLLRRRHRRMSSPTCSRRSVFRGKPRPARPHCRERPSFSARPCTARTSAMRYGSVFCALTIRMNRVLIMSSRVQVLPKPSSAQAALDAIVNWILEHHQSDTGIIYTLSRADSENITKGINAHERARGKLRAAYCQSRLLELGSLSC